MDDYLIAFAVLAVFCLIASRGEEIQSWAEARKIKNHTCPTRCLESIRCRCGCEGFTNPALQQEACAVCGTPILYEYGDDDYQGPFSYLDPSSPTARSGEITEEFPAPKGFTSWGWERDREFRRARKGEDE